MINKPFDDVKKEDVDELVANQVGELRTLEYKEKTPGGTDDNKKEFLADISSFANSSGGDILFGVVEKRDATTGRQTGLPDRAVGLAGVNIGTEIPRLESIIRDGIAPRISGVRMTSIDGFDQGPVIFIRIPKSWSAPHMVSFKSGSRFFARNSAGKYQLDVAEIRSAFAFSEALPERIRSFRADRLSKIIADETPVAIKKSPKAVLHLVPLSALSHGAKVDLTPYDPNRQQLPLAGNQHPFRINFDGLLVSGSNSPQEGVEEFYLQVYRNGVFEAVYSSVNRLWYVGNKKIYPQYEVFLVKEVRRYLSWMKGLCVEPPIFIMVSLLDVRGCLMNHQRQIARPMQGQSFYIETEGLRDTPIDRDNLIISDVLIQGLDCNVEVEMKPIFDAVWNATGWHGSVNYDEKGNPIPEFLGQCNRE